jgi:hypothetical protein
MLRTEKSPDDIRTGLRKHGVHKVAIFETWFKEFLG